MSELSLVYPMLALVLLTCGVLIVLFRSRVRMVREGLAPVSYFRVFQGSPEPEFAAKPARHFTNLFEAPTIFYAGCLTAMVTGVTRSFNGAQQVVWQASFTDKSTAIVKTQVP